MGLLTASFPGLAQLLSYACFLMQSRNTSLGVVLPIVILVLLNKSFIKKMPYRGQESLFPHMSRFLSSWQKKKTSSTALYKLPTEQPGLLGTFIFNFWVTKRMQKHPFTSQDVVLSHVTENMWTFFTQKDIKALLWCECLWSSQISRLNPTPWGFK